MEKQKLEGFDPTQNERRNKQAKKILTGIGIALIVMLIAVGGTVWNLIHTDAGVKITRGPSASITGQTDSSGKGGSTFDYINEDGYIDSDKYYADSATVLDKFDAESSKDNLSEKDVIELLASKGFYKDGDVISTSYDLDGTYNVVQVSETKTIHPTYTMYYTTESEIWNITITNGQISATPTLHNLANAANGETIVCETEEIYAYDSIQNVFYKLLPNTDVLIVKVIDQITPDTLNNIEW